MVAVRDSALHKHILGTRVDPTSYSRAVEQVLEMAQEECPGYICAANVHMIMEGYDSPEFREMVNGADLVTPDGMPLVWALKGLGHTDQKRVYGPTLMLRVCEAAGKAGVPVGCLGSTESVLQKLKQTLKMRFPSLQITYMHAPPFRPLSSVEVDTIANDIREAGAKIVFVGFGCPKQERWMAGHKGKLKTVMVVVGAAFDFHAGEVRQSPNWMQKLGLEWLFRLSREPKRLWRRYFYNNPRYVVLIIRELIREKLNRKKGKNR